jgi:hypothetical protein
VMLHNYLIKEGFMQSLAVHACMFALLEMMQICASLLSFGLMT